MPEILKMDHLLIKITDFEIIEPYTLRLTFEDGAKRTINFEPVLYGHYYGPLRDLRLFNQVEIDQEIHTLVWPNGADFDPATLYNWYKGDGQELAMRAIRWRQNEVTATA
jgi:hypothetical protein